MSIRSIEFDATNVAPHRASEIVSMYYDVVSVERDRVWFDDGR